MSTRGEGLHVVSSVSWSGLGGGDDITGQVSCSVSTCRVQTFPHVSAAERLSVSSVNWRETLTQLRLLT